MVAVNSVSDTKFVARSLPFQRSTEPGTNPEPVMVICVLPEPAGIASGATAVSTGAGFGAAPSSATLTITAFDTPPPGGGVNTVTAKSPSTAMSDAGIAACSVVESTYVVGLSAPFQRTTEPGTKLPPSTSNVKPGPPTVTLAGVAEEIDGTPVSPDRSTQ